ncbi:hypothetical protein HN51_016419, partial [Arachis hypogaea]
MLPNFLYVPARRALWQLPEDQVSSIREAKAWSQPCFKVNRMDQFAGAEEHLAQQGLRQKLDEVN